MSFTPSENPITHPERESYTQLRPFRFWCQKVLPLVYDNSLSYYELLCKVVDYLNKTMEDVDHMNTDIDTLYTNFQEFQEGTFQIYNELVAYVNSYFDNLDVQEQINNKLDEMVTSGELVTILQPSIADEVSTWLSEHITPTTPTIDNTLTVSGAGADAQTVGNIIGLQYSNAAKYKAGDIVLHNGSVYRCIANINTPEEWTANHWRITKLSYEMYSVLDAENEIIDNYKYNSVLTQKWILGNLNAAGTIETITRTRATTLGYLITTRELILVFKASVQIILCTYNSDLTLINRTTRAASTDNLRIPPNTIFRMTVYVNDTTDVNNALDLGKNVLVTNKIGLSTEEYIDRKDMFWSRISADWANATLDLQGRLVYDSTGYEYRAATRNFIKATEDLTIRKISTNFSAFFVCLYNEDKTLLSRTQYTYTATIPANTFFRVMVDLVDTTAWCNPAIASYAIVCNNKDYSYLMGYTNDSSRLINAGKLLLKSNVIIGNLYTDGDIRFLKSRVTFCDYMQYPEDIYITVGNSSFNVILCTYNSDYTLLNRTVLTRPVNVIKIPENTIFRLCVYNPTDEAETGFEVTNPLTYAEQIYIDVKKENVENIPDVIAIFESFVAIGDSLTCGYVASGTGQSYSSSTAREAKRNWADYLALKINRTLTNIARGGSSARDWRYGNVSADVNIEYADVNTYCYFVALGVNDLRNALTVGTSADIKTDKANNTDSFYGNYDFIIRQLIEYKTAKLSQCKIFAFTMPSNITGCEPYNAAIRYIAGLYTDVYVIDLYKEYYSEFLTEPWASVWIGGHSRPIGYYILGEYIRKAINKFMLANTADFAYTPWLPLS